MGRPLFERETDCFADLASTVITVMSLFLDNVTTVVLMVPVTILISEIMGISPIPLLIALVICPMLTPPNLLIGSAANLSFNDFLINALPVVIVAWLIVLVILLFLFRKEMR